MAPLPEHKTLFMTTFWDTFYNTKTCIRLSWLYSHCCLVCKENILSIDVHFPGTVARHFRLELFVSLSLFSRFCRDWSLVGTVHVLRPSPIYASCCLLSHYDYLSFQWHLIDKYLVFALHLLDNSNTVYNTLWRHPVNWSYIPER